MARSKILRRGIVTVVRLTMWWLVGLWSLSAACSARTTDPAANLDAARPQVGPLRSAWIVREAKALPLAAPQTMAEEREQLQRHFRLVEAILIANTPRSLNVAAARFERARGRRLSAADRQRLVTVLYYRRGLQIARLAAYREAGRFPLNLDSQTDPKPIFVDAAGTPCAVGFLMLCSGMTDDVAAIVHNDNFVVVTDVRTGPVVAWVRQSGLTQEEAALIQPMYSPPSIYEGTLSEYLLPGAAIERDGLTFSSLLYQTYAEGSASNDSDNTYLITDLSDITYDPADPYNGKYFHPSGTNFLALHGDIGTAPSTGDLFASLLEFDVAVNKPSTAISALRLTANLQHFHVSAAHPDGFAQIYAGVWTSQQIHLGDVEIGDPHSADFFNSYIQASRELAFPPIQYMHVALMVWLEDDAEADDFTLEFTVVPVPEPATLSMGLFAVVMLIGLNWRRVTSRGSH